MQPSGRAETGAESISARHGARHRGLPQRIRRFGQPRLWTSIEGLARGPEATAAAVRPRSMHGGCLGRCRPVRRGQVSVGLEHPDPARRVAPDYQRRHPLEGSGSLRTDIYVAGNQNRGAQAGYLPWSENVPRASIDCWPLWDIENAGRHQHSVSHR